MAVVLSQSVYKLRVRSAVIEFCLVRCRHMMQGIALLPVQQHLPAAGKRKHGTGIIVKQLHKRAKACLLCKPVVAKHHLDIVSLRHFERGIPVKNMSIRLLVVLVLYLRITLVNQGFCLIIGRII